LGKAYTYLRWRTTLVAVTLVLVQAGVASVEALAAEAGAVEIEGIVAIAEAVPAVATEEARAEVVVKGRKGSGFL